jgi:predicted ATP-dependent serine protease
MRYEPNAYDYKEDDERIDNGWNEHKKHNRDIKIDYTEPEIETPDEPYFFTAMDILKRPEDGEEYIRSGIEGIDNRLGGLKKKYVTLMTGLRGGSKSTLLTTIALTAIQDGNNVLCYSGELSEQDFMKWMNLQAAGKNHVHESKMRNGFYYPDDGVEEKVARWLGNHFWLWNNFHGNNFNKIYRLLVSKIEEQKTDLVILDNLMAIDIHDLNERDKYAAQGEFVELLMQLAKKTNTHIIFVAHPRKAFGLLRLDDVAGTGNLTNRIDNAFIVHRNNQDFQRLSKEMFKWKEDHDAYKGTNVIEIAKDRHNGHMDVFIPLWYEKETKRLKNAPAEMIQYGWDKSDGFGAVDDDEIPFT